MSKEFHAPEKKLKVGVLGATGMVGQRLVTALGRSPLMCSFFPTSRFAAPIVAAAVMGVQLTKLGAFLTTAPLTACLT